MATEIKANNVTGKNVQIGKTNKGKGKLKIGEPKSEKAPDKTETAPKVLIAYSMAYMLLDLVGGIPLPRTTLDEFEKIKEVKNHLQEAVSEYQGKMSEIYEFYGIKKQVKENHPKYNEVIKKLDALFATASSLDLEKIQVYTYKDAATMASGGRHKDGNPFVFDTIELVIKSLTKEN